MPVALFYVRTSEPKPNYVGLFTRTCVPRAPLQGNGWEVGLVILFFLQLTSLQLVRRARVKLDNTKAYKISTFRILSLGSLFNLFF